MRTAILLGAFVVYLWIGDLLTDQMWRYHRGPWWRRGPFLVFQRSEFTATGEPHRAAAARWYIIGAVVLGLLWLGLRVV